MINFQLAKEIYGITPWLMDLHSIPVMSAILNDMRSGVKFDKVENKLNSPLILAVNQETRVISRPYGDGWTPGQLENNDDFSGVGLIKLNGPITRSGGASSRGMVQLSNLMYKMAGDSRIKGFVIEPDSGGGSSSAVQTMNKAISEINKTKPVHTYIPSGAMACSAAYGIISGSKTINCEDPMSIVGSLGTMIQFEGKKANTENNGLKHIRLYATKSVAKNKAMEEALNNNNYELLISEMLDPINEDFLSMIGVNREKVKNINYQDGAHYFAKDVKGSLIDDFTSFENVVDMIVGDSKQTYKEKKKINLSTNINNKNKMTEAEFKAANPEAYNKILADGVAQEKDRCGAWMAHVATDQEAVVEGIKSGKPISQSDREALFVKQNATNTAKTIVDESAKDIATGESLTDAQKTEQEKHKAEVDAAFDFELN